MPVSPATETKLRAAMQRLLNGTPHHTDGALTKENLARKQESATPPSTAPRRSSPNGTPVLSSPPARQATTVPAGDPVTALRAALRDANQKITTLNGRLDALATVTANLYRENQALRAALDHRTQIAPLPGKEGH